MLTRYPLFLRFASSVRHDYRDPFMRIMHPFKYLKWKMERTDRAREVYELCSTRFEKDPRFIKAFGLPEQFNSWFAVTVLHVWMYSTRLRAEGAQGREMRQEIFEHLWLDIELKLAETGIKMNLSKIVDELLSLYYGQTLAYDEGLATGDATLAAALWRNVYETADVDATQLEQMVKYIHSQLASLENAEAETVLEAKVKFDS